MSKETINDKLMIQFQKNIEMHIPIKIGSYTNMELIAETRNSLVINSIDTESNRKLAIKYIPYEKFGLTSSQIQIMKSVDDPRIIKVLDFFQYPNQISFRKKI